MGFSYAVATDVMALLAYGLGSLKRLALGQKKERNPVLRFGSSQTQHHLAKQSPVCPASRVQ